MRKVCVLIAAAFLLAIIGCYDDPAPRRVAVEEEEEMDIECDNQ